MPKIPSRAKTLIATLPMVFAAWSCWAAETIRVGAVYPLTGPVAEDGAVVNLDRVLILWRLPDGARAAGLYTIAIMGTGWSLDLAGRIVLVMYTAFQTTNFTNVPVVNLPVNVVTVCSLTFACTPPPVGPNIHPNEIGYGLIAATFAQKIGTI